jgi:hypothetical protein
MLFMVASLAGQGAHVWRYSVITFTGIAHHDCGSVSRLNPSLVAPDLLPDLIIPTGKRKGQHPSVASIYRTLAEHDKAQAYPEALEQAHAEFASRTRAQPGCMRAGRRRCLVRRFLHRPQAHARVSALVDTQQAGDLCDAPEPRHPQPGTDQPATAVGYTSSTAH